MISSQLGMEPKYQGKSGQQRQTPKGLKLNGIYAESYWSADPFDRGEYLSTDEYGVDALAEVLTVLTPHRSFFLLLKEQGARMHLQISSYSGRNYAFEFPPEFMLQCAALGLSLVHDVYPCHQNW